MGVIALTKQFVKILVLVWMPVTAPYAALQCPSHQLSDDPTKTELVQDMSMSMASDHCQHEKSSDQTQEDPSAHQCDCPSCELISAISLVPELHVDHNQQFLTDFIAIRYRGIHLKQDTPPPQI